MNVHREYSITLDTSLFALIEREILHSNLREITYLVFSLYLTYSASRTADPSLEPFGSHIHDTQFHTLSTRPTATHRLRPVLARSCMVRPCPVTPTRRRCARRRFVRLGCSTPAMKRQLERWRTGWQASTALQRQPTRWRVGSAQQL